jgi:hypothetical protein
MTKNFLEQMSRIALFRASESEPGIPSTDAGVSMDFDSGSEIKSTIAVEHDGETIHGSETPTRLYASHREAKGTLSQKRAKPDFLAFVLAYFFGECASAPLGDTAYRHTITPVSGLHLPSFTIIQRRAADIFTERLAGNYLESFKLELGPGWVSLSAEVVGTGNREVNYDHEVVSAPANALAITLAEKAVEGDTEAARRANVYRVRAKDAGSEAWETLTVSAVSDTTPAVITFAQALGESGNSVDYHVDYIPAAPAWCTLPEYGDESPLKLVEARVVVDGFWDGNELLGGVELQGEALAFSVAGKNNLELRHFPGASGPAAGAVRGGRELTINLTETLRDTVRQYQSDHPETETVAVALLLQGAEIDPAGPRFGAELIFPRCGIMAAPVVVQGKRLAQAGDLIVLDHQPESVVVRCFNRQQGYISW